MKRTTNLILRTLFALSGVCVTAAADDFELHRFQRQQLTDVYFSEGASAGDLNGDKIADVVYGPYWFAGPDFSVKQEIYPPVPQDINRYADNFFSWIYDFDGDGWNDVLVAGFPGTPAYVYMNPKSKGLVAHWTKHQVFDWVSNESPQLVNLVDDERPELICTRDGFFGFVTVDWKNPFGTWDFHPISEQVTATKFGHGLGVGDINGDGRMDILHSKGWFEQPEVNAESSRWRQHDVTFSQSYGGAEMYAYDVDGDGDNDVITSEAAHEFGLAWYEQIQADGGTQFERHLIMGSHASENPYGTVFSELHSVNLVDIDGDGLKDIVTGKTYWSHHKQSPMWDAGAVVYWFKLARTKDGVNWVPYKADGEAGIGRQLTVMDVNEDGLPDMVVGGMKGSHVLIHKSTASTKEQWENAQPKRYEGPKLPSTKNVKTMRGPKSLIDDGTGRVAGALEAESLPFKVSAGQAKPQAMSAFRGDRWSGNSQLRWSGGRPGDKMTIDLPVFTGTVDLEVVLTCARDYGMVQLSLDGIKLGKPIDLYHRDVITTGVLSFPNLTVNEGTHSLAIEIIGANTQAQKSFLVAVDYVRVK